MPISPAIQFGLWLLVALVLFGNQDIGIESCLATQIELDCRCLEFLRI